MWFLSSLAFETRRLKYLFIKPFSIYLASMYNLLPTTTFPNNKQPPHRAYLLQFSSCRLEITGDPQEDC